MTAPAASYRLVVAPERAARLALLLVRLVRPMTLEELREWSLEGTGLELDDDLSVLMLAGLVEAA